MIGDNTESFGTIDYDDYVDLLPQTKWKNYKNSEAAKNLVELIKEYDAVFGDLDSEPWKLRNRKDYQ